MTQSEIGKKVLPNVRYIWQFLKKYPRDLIIILMTTILSILTILSIGQIVRFFIDHHNDPYVNQSVFPLYLLLIIIVTISVSAFFRITRTFILSEKIYNDISLNRLTVLLKCKYSVFETNSIGDLQSRISTDINEIKNFIANSAAVGLRNVIQLIASTIFLFFANHLLSCCVLIILPLILVPLKILGKKSRQKSSNVQNFEGNINGTLEEMLSAVMIIKAFNAENNLIKTIQQLLNSKLSLSRQKAFFRGFNVALVIFLVFSSIIFILYIGLWQISHHAITPGNLTSFIFYAVLLVNALNNFTDIVAQANIVSGAVTRITALDYFPTESVNTQSGRVMLQQENAEIIFKDVTFYYQNDSNYLALDCISLRIKPGEKVALVGVSGAGKSTLLKLLMGIYQPQQGQILIDQHDHQTIDLNKQRSYFSYVSQDIVLFNGTIYDNMTFMNPNFTLESVINASKISLVDEFALDLPNQYNTLIGPKGMKLSGGQKQRISLARALIHDSPVILLDEATNALDNLSESIIQQTLLNPCNKKTVIIIAHRLSTIQHVDQIFVMYNKSVIASGTHQELMLTCPYYHKLYTTEFKV